LDSLGGLWIIFILGKGSSFAWLYDWDFHGVLVPRGFFQDSFALEVSNGLAGILGSLQRFSELLGAFVGNYIIVKSLRDLSSPYILIINRRSKSF